MKAPQKTSIQSAIKKGQFIVTISILVTCGIGFVLNNYFLAKRSISKTVESTAYVLSQGLGAPLMFQDVKVATQTLSSLESHPLLRGGVVLDTQNKIFASYPAMTRLPSPEIGVTHYSFPIQVQGDVVGSLVLFVREEIQPSALVGYGLVGMIVLLVGFVIAQLLTRMTSQAITQQISSLLQVIRAISHSGDYSKRVVGSTHSEEGIAELHELSTEFDGMLRVVESRNQEINAINSNLESLVEQKTKELRETQGSLVQSSKMSALGEMSAGIAHEINNPLAIISGKSQQILSMVERGQVNLESLSKLALSIDSTVERISKIIKGLRSFSRDGSQDPFETTKIKSIVDDALELCKTKFKNHGVDLQVAGFDPELVFDCRATQVGQVIMNLLNNAHDAISTLETKWVRLEVLDEGEMIVFSVTDSGSGIPESVRKKIMQPFFTTKEIGKGTGLGLSISKGIVEGHHGRLEIDAHCPNTRFLVRLPKTQAESEKKAA